MTNTFVKSRNFFISFLLLLSALFGTSCGKGSSTSLEIDGVDGPTLSLEEEFLIVKATFENFDLSGSLTYSLEAYENSYLNLYEAEEGGTTLEMHVSLVDISNDALTYLEEQNLPGGRNIPGVSTGTLPAFNFKIKELEGLAFYLSNDYFGAFVPLKGLNIGTNNIVTANFYVSDSKIGTLSAVGPDENEENAGFFLLLNLTKTTKKRMKGIIKKYR